jgi:hypothetical protein
MVTKKPLIGNLGGGFASAIGHVKVSDCPHAIGGVTDGVQGLVKTESQGAYHAGRHYCDASRATYSV